MRGPQVRFCERRGGVIHCAYSTRTEGGRSPTGVRPPPGSHFFKRYLAVITGWVRLVILLGSMEGSELARPPHQ